MTESSFPFETQGQTAPLDDYAEDGGRKPLLLVGGLVGALVLGASAFLFLGGDDAEEELAVPIRPPATAAPLAEPEGITVVPAASTEQLGRNPFKARYVEPVAAPAPAEAPAPAPVAAPPPPAVNLVIQQAAPAPAPAEQQAPAEYPITLKSVEPTGPSGITYTWVIDEKEISVFQAQRFGKYGELVVLALESAEDGPRAVLQVGDATPIRVKVGETVNVL